MNSDYISYALIEICLIMQAFVIYSKLNYNIGSEYEVKRLKNLIIAFWIVLITDIFWAFTEAKLIIPPRLMNASVNAISISAVTFGCYYWFDYVVSRTKFMSFNTNIKKFIKLFPLVFTVSLNMISIFTGWVFQIDSNSHYIYGPLFGIQVVGTYIYLVIATIIAILKAKNVKLKSEKNEYIVYALYMVPPIISGFIEDFFPSAPILYMCMFFVILIVFTTIQDLQIYNDSLTGLNNRKKLELYLQESSIKKEKLLIFMMDIDKFKSINDTYGHIQGDYALKIVARALQLTSSKYGGFIARYGGDEFCYILIDNNKSSEIKQCIRNNLDNLQVNNSFPISLSIGYYNVTGKEKNITSCIEEADKALYVDKQRII